jgi:prevent-host-death family protein
MTHSLRVDYSGALSRSKSGSNAKIEEARRKTNWVLTGHMNMTIMVIREEILMKTAAVSELKARLSEYLNQVKAGMEVLITDRGKPVARLVPVSRNKDLKESLVRMEKQGLIRLGPGKLPKDFWKIPRPEDPEGLVLKALLEEREAGR